MFMIGQQVGRQTWRSKRCRRWALRMAPGLCMLPLSFVGAQAAMPSAVSLLERSLGAASRVPFQGRQLTVQWSDDRHSEAAEARYFRQGTSERTQYLAPRSLVGEVVVIVNGRLFSYDAPRRRLVVEPAPRRSPEDPVNLHLLLHNYVVSVKHGVYPVAGHPCYELSIRPRQSGKPSRKIWVDTRTGVMLKTEHHRPDGSLEGTTLFTSAVIGKPIPPSTFFLKTPKGTRIIVRSDRPPAAKGVRAARGGSSVARSRLPLGFVLSESSPSTADPHQWHFRYTDGLDLLSYFVGSPARRLPEGRKIRRFSLDGLPAVLISKNRFQVLTWNHRNQNLMLIGDLSVSAMLRIADVLR